MALPFSQTLRALDADRGRAIGTIAWVLVWLLAAAWGLWFVGAEVQSVESTADARLEVRRAPLPVMAPVAGRVVESRLRLDTSVDAGDVLLRLDTAELELALRDQEARRAAVDAELAALGGEQDQRRRMADGIHGGTDAVLDEARALLAEAEVAARLAADDAARLARLHAAGQVSAVDVLHQEAEAEKLRSAADSVRQGLERLRTTESTRESEQRAQLAELGREAARLAGTRATSAVEIDRIRYEIERRTVRAPVAGRLAEVSTLLPSSMVSAGDHLCTLLPADDLQVVAHFDPNTALGRLHPGQPAVVRLDGFPWTQFGVLTAEVERVAREPRDGRLRVELRLAAPPPPTLPVTHGLTGTVEIEVERLSPAALVLRAAGQILTGD